MEVAVPPQELNQEKLQQIMDESAAQARAEVKEEDSTLTLGAIGSPYMVGPIDITVAIGNMVLLNEIDSPFMTGEIGKEGSDLNAVECIKSLYVLGVGKEAVKPIMAIKQRIQSMLKLKTMVEGKPELFEALMDRVERIADGHADFEEAAMNWYEENFVGWDFQEVISQTFIALNDAMKAAGDLPEADSKKKQAQ